MAEIKTREKSKGIKALDKAVVAGERMKRAFVRSKDQAENLLDDGQISPSEYAEDKVRYMAEDTAREVGHEAGKLTGKAKSACRSHREAKRTADAAQQDIYLDRGISPKVYCCQPPVACCFISACCNIRVSTESPTGLCRIFL